MRWFQIRGAAIALAATALLTAGKAQALPFTLLQLTDGSTPTFTVGALTFSGFNATSLGAHGTDLSVYSVDVVGTNLQISGPLSVGAGQSGQLALQYTVSSTTPFAAVSLGVTGAVTGGYAAIGEQWLDALPGAPGIQLAVTRVQLNPGDTTGSFSAPLAGAPTVLRIEKEITLIDGASLTSPIVQGYTLVPEPSVAVLMGLGLAGLTLKGRRRN